LALTWIKRPNRPHRGLIQIKAPIETMARMKLKLFEGCQLVWSSTRILWDQQIFLLWLLLTPVFLGCALLVFAAPLIFRDEDTRKAEKDAFAGQTNAAPEPAKRKAA
jgi:hypothetical protein